MKRLKNERLFDFIKRHEGLRLEPYKDTVGKWTVFYGRNINDVPTAPEELLSLLTHGRSEEVAEIFLKNDIEGAKSDCEKIFSEFDYFSNDRKISLISVMFNLGLNRFRGFKKMIKAVRDNKWDIAHDELLDSRRAKQLPARSKEEAGMLKTGWSENSGGAFHKGTYILDSTIN